MTSETEPGERCVEYSEPYEAENGIFRVVYLPERAFKVFETFERIVSDSMPPELRRNLQIHLPDQWEYVFAYKQSRGLVFRKREESEKIELQIPPRAAQRQPGQTYEPLRKKQDEMTTKRMTRLNYPFFRYAVYMPTGARFVCEEKVWKVQKTSTDERTLLKKNGVGQFRVRRFKSGTFQRKKMSAQRYATLSTKIQQIVKNISETVEGDGAAVTLNEWEIFVIFFESDLVEVFCAVHPDAGLVAGDLNDLVGASSREAWDAFFALLEIEEYELLE
jgi:hypothetical protein